MFLDEEWIFIEGNTKDIARNALITMHTVAKSCNVWDWYAHNGGKYDALFMLAAAEEMGWEAKAIISGGRMIQLRVKPMHELKWLCLNDSMAIVQSSLKNAANDFALKSSKLLGEEDYSVDVRLWSRERLESGCKADCMLVLELLDKVESLVLQWGGKLKLTFSAIALSIVQNRVDLETVRVPQNLTARESYCGGRVEVFHHAPQHELTEFDVTSSYPWSMTQPLPWKYTHSTMGAKHAEKAMREESAIVFAKVSVPESTYVPSLPYRHEEGGVFFPTGEWGAWFTSVELRHAMSHGVKVRPILADVYTTEKPFESFVSEVFETKRTAKGALRNFAKLILNGCYGKFAQRPEKEIVEIFGDDAQALEAIMKAPNGTIRILSQYTPRYISRKSVKWPRQTHYALASFITAHSRILLHKALITAKGLAYTDTDSVHASTETVYDTGEKLGQLKIEIPAMQGQYFSAKLYRLTTPEKTIHASKGFEVKGDIFARMVQGETIEREQMRLAKTMLREEMKLKVTRPTTARTWRGLSMKRAVLDNGDTRPWTMQELLKNRHLSSKSYHRR